MAVKIIATKSNGGIKIVELGNELRVDPRQIVAAAKEMAMENAKVPASWVTAGQADRLRAKFGGQGELKAKIERKLRHFEGALETPTEAPKVDTSIKTHSVKLGKRTYEADRRAIFGVVSTAGGVSLQRDTPTQKSGDTTKKTEATEAASGTTSPVAEAANASLAVPLPPAKKFIQVAVAPPIRRDPSSPDPRFGVIVASPEVEKKEGSTAIWSNLKDGHAPVDFSTPSSTAEKKYEPVAEPATEAPPVVETVAKSESSKHSGRKPRIEVAVAETSAPSAHVSSAVHVHETEHRKRTMDVPVKWQPKNKAFGSKAKHKTKVLKKLETQGSDNHVPIKHATASAKTHESKSHSKNTEPVESAAQEMKHASERRAAVQKSAEHNATHGKDEGVLQRFLRKIFKK